MQALRAFSAMTSETLVVTCSVVAVAGAAVKAVLRVRVSN
jgi:hypothetical protein